MAKLLGRSSLLHICAHAPDGEEAHVHARVPGVFLPAEGQPVTLRLDPSQVFVFPSLPAGARAAHGQAEQDHRHYAYDHDGQ